MRWGRVSRVLFVCIALAMLGWLVETQSLVYGAQESDLDPTSAAVIGRDKAERVLVANTGPLAVTLADPSVVSVSPPRNALAVSPTASIQATFNVSMSVTTLTTRTIVAHGAQTGRLSATLAYDDVNFTAVLTPAVSFKPGEIVWTSVTSDVHSFAGHPITPTVWQFTTDAAEAGGIFAGHNVHGVGSNPQSIATGDLDGDGDLDLVTSNYDDSTILVLYNDGNRIFTPGNAAVTIENGPGAVATGDVDEDGDLDLVAVNSGTDNVTVLLNQGDGVFSNQALFSVGDDPRHVALGDIDADGDLDMIVADYADNDLSVLFNNGNGVFGSRATCTVANKPRWVAVGDFDKDGDLDLAAASDRPISANVSVLRNVGDGTFASHVTYDAAGKPFSISIGDLNQDGHLDLVVSGGSTSNTLSILRNDGSGSFTGTGNYTVGTEPRRVAIGDWDGDGDLDLAVANYAAGTVSVLRNTGSGNFAAQVVYGVESGPNSLVMGDLDADGDLDLAVSNSSSNTVSILYNNRPPDVPHSPTPPDGASSVSLTPFLSWQCDDPDGDGVTFTVRLGTTLSPPVVAQNVTTHTYSPGVLQPYTTYYWVITATDGLSSTAGGLWSFTTLPITPTGVVLSGPSSAWVGASQTFTAEVSPVTATQPITYVWQATEQTMVVHSAISSHLDTASFTWTTPGTKTITVTATNAGGTVQDTHIIVLPNRPPDVPHSPTPPDGASGVSLTPLVSWQCDDPDGDGVTFTVRLGTTLSPPVVAQNVTTHTYSPDVLQPYTTYYWGITATDGLSSTAGGLWSFITLPITPTGVVLSGPFSAWVGASQTFTAEVSPVTATQPITYVWQATEQTMVVHSAISSHLDTASFTWAAPGTKTITVTATNAGGTVQDTRAISLVLLLPDMTLAPPTLTITLDPNATSSSTLTIGNVGDADLAWSVAEVPSVAWLSESPTSTLVPKSGSQDVVVSFDTTGLSENVYTTTLRFTSNDPRSPLDVPVTLTVEAGCVAIGGADFTFEPAAPKVGQVITFTGMVTAGTGTVTYTWSMGDGYLSSGSVITHTYWVSHVFTVVMTATNGCPSLDTARHDVAVRPAQTFIYLPLVLRRFPPVPDTPVLAEIDNADGDGSYRISWSNANLATSYVLEEATLSTFADATLVYSDTATFVDLAGRGAARYYYRVKARNAWGDSDWSNVRWADVLWEAEPNDTDGQANGPLVSGLTYYGTFSGASGTSDYFYFDLLVEHSVELWLTNIPAGSDYDLVLYDSDLAMKGYSGFTGSRDERIPAQLLPVGRYFVRVYHRDGQGSTTQPYHLRVIYQ